MQDDSLGYPPRSEQQATRLEHNLAAWSRSTCHDSNLSYAVSSCRCRIAFCFCGRLATWRGDKRQQYPQTSYYTSGLGDLPTGNAGRNVLVTQPDYAGGQTRALFLMTMSSHGKTWGWGAP